MLSFLQRHADKVSGTLSGFDRLRFRGTIRWLANLAGLKVFLSHAGILLKHFKEQAQATTAAIRQQARNFAASAGLQPIYLTGKISKEDEARRLAAERGVREGLVAVLECVEPCWTYKVAPNPQAKRLELRYGPGKCLHQYFYFLDANLGLMHARLQTWYPFTMHLCINGREWLARQMDAAGIGYRQHDNCFVEVADPQAAQRLLDEQLQTPWEQMLNAIADRVFPTRRSLSPSRGVDYYWSADQTEWATDLLFHSGTDLAALYPRLIQHGITTFSSVDVMRFLGRPVAENGRIHQRFEGEVVSDIKRRPEGIRIKHRLNNNSLKMYDKQGSVLRVETTINDPRDMKVFRVKEGAAKGSKEWLRLRKGVADLQRRAVISQASNERYLQALSSVEEATPLRELTEPVSQPVQWQGRRVRGLNTLHPTERSWLQAIGHGEFVLNGFRNRDLRQILFGDAPDCVVEKRRQAAKVTRIVRLLRAHGLIQKVAKTHRYQVTDKGRLTITGVLSAQAADVAKLAALAA